MKKILFIFSLITNCLLQTLSFSQGTWNQKADFGGMPRQQAFAFSIGTKGYIGSGGDASLSYPYYQDFWEWDQTNDVWTQKANYYSDYSIVYSAIGFSVGTKGYAGTGKTSQPLSNAISEYDPATNTWTKKAMFTSGRMGAVGFSIGTRGYAGTGYDAVSAPYAQDFWEYDPASNSWTQKASFGGGGRIDAVGFSIGSKGYIGTGRDLNYKNDFWEYDPSTNTWVQKANFGGTAREGAVGFSIGSKGYIGTGRDPNYKNDFWEYDPSADTWTQKAIFGGAARYEAVGFSIGSKGYIGTGMSFGGIVQTDFWEYYDSATGMNELNNSSDVSVFPNPSTGQFQIFGFGFQIGEIEIYNTFGKKVYSEKIPNPKSLIFNLNLPNGIYFVKVIAKNEECIRKIIIQN